MVEHDRLQLYEDVKQHMYVVQPLPLLEIYRLAALCNVNTEGLSAKAVADRAFDIADACMARRHHGNNK